MRSLCVRLTAVARASMTTKRARGAQKIELAQIAPCQICCACLCRVAGSVAAGSVARARRSYSSQHEIAAM